MTRHLKGVVLSALVALAAACSAMQANAEVPQSIGGTVKPSKDLPPLKLSEQQRSRVQAAVAAQDTDVSFALKNAKASRSFAPSVGAKIPAGLKIQAFPSPLIQEIPLLKRYTYIKFKDQLLIINPMSHEIVDMIAITKT